MVRKIRYALLGLLVLSVCGAGAMVGFAENAPAEGNAQLYKDLNLFGSVLARVRSDYVEKPDDNKLIEDAINGMLAALDPHSTYMNGKEFREMQVQTRGEFGGLGIEVTMENGAIKVVAPIEDTPAAKAGLLSGDLIVALDKEPIEGLTLDQAVEKMRGPINAPITLTIKRKGIDNAFDVTMTRDVIRIKPVKFAGRGRRRLCARHQLQRADHLRAGEGDLGAEADDRSEAQGLHHRFAQRSRRPAGSGHLGVRLPFSTRAPSCSPRGAILKRRSAPMRDPATSPTASRSWC